VNIYHTSLGVRWIRTKDLHLRRQLLYPAELRDPQIFRLTNQPGIKKNAEAFLPVWLFCRNMAKSLTGSVLFYMPSTISLTPLHCIWSCRKVSSCNGSPPKEIVAVLAEILLLASFIVSHINPGLRFAIRSIKFLRSLWLISTGIGYRWARTPTAAPASNELILLYKEALPLCIDKRNRFRGMRLRLHQRSANDPLRLSDSYFRKPV